MPAAETTGPPGAKRSTTLLQLLFWGGVGLAPLAALLLLVGSGFVLQFAAVLGLLAVVLIGLSIALRREGETVKGEVEEMVYEEIDTLRENVRADITHAARQTHGQLTERIGVLHETVDALRNQVEMLRGQLERAAAQPPPPAHPTGSAPAAPGVLRHTETVQVTTKTMVVDPTESRSGTVYGAGPRADIPQQRRPDRSERMPARPEPRGEEYGRRPERRDDYAARDGYAPRDDYAPRDERRQERREERRDNYAARDDYAARDNYAGRENHAARDERRDDSGRREERPRDQVREQAREQTSWTEQLLRERMARSESGEWAQTQSRPTDIERRGGGGRRRAVEDDDDENVTGMRTTDRWASVHSDERGGRELRMGERRSAVHADETGTHVRIEDRWASVRHEEYYSDGGGHRAAPDDDRRGERRGGRRRAEPDDHDDETLDPRAEGRYDAGTESPRRSEARRERERKWASGEHARVEVGRRPEEHWAETSYEEGRRDDTGSTRWSEVRRSDRALGGPQAALPASPAEPASRWTSGEERWAGPREDERVSRRARPDDEEYGWNGGRDEHRGGRAARQIVDFEGNDDRWR